MRKRTKIIGGSILGLAVLGVIGQATGAGADSASTTPPAAASTSTPAPAAPAPTSKPEPTTKAPPASKPAPAPKPEPTTKAPPASKPAPAPKPEPTTKASAAPACHPSYVGACLDPTAADYDCIGGSGNGPEYTGRVTVVGPDVFGLDHDGDGIGCE